MSNEKGIDPKKLNAMKMKILKAEQENLRTKDKTTDQMVDHIRKIITTEAKKGFRKLQVQVGHVHGRTS